MAVLPRHNEATPSLLAVLRKHSAIPSYLRSRRPVFNISSCKTLQVSSGTKKGVSESPIFKPCGLFLIGVLFMFDDRQESCCPQNVEGWSRHTWFWIRSLTRSMGAAAVFDTAAETPPTTFGQLCKLLKRRMIGCPSCEKILFLCNGSAIKLLKGCRRDCLTQKVDHEALEKRSC